MESKIFIDINYSSRDPQIVIHSKESDDPRDKLVSMLTGHSMPGVRDGYCRIERYPGPAKEGVDIAVITPVHPIELIKHIPEIARLALNNASCDTSKVPETYREIIEGECRRLNINGVAPAEGPTVLDPKVAEGIKHEAIKKVDDWAVENLSPDVYKKWRKDIYGIIPGLKPSQG